MIVTCDVRFQIRDWTMPPVPGSLESFTLYHRGRTVNYKRIDFVKFLQEVFEKLDQGYRVYMTDLHLLLATLVWNRQQFGAKAEHLKEAIWKRQLVSINDLTSTARGVRGIRSLLEKTQQLFEIGDLVRECESFEKWLERKWGENMGYHLGAHVETLGRAAATCVTWKGAQIDRDLLEKGLEHLSSREEVHGLETTLSSHYRQVYQALRSDDRVHPVYVRQKTYRLGSLWPNIQNFSASGDEFGSKRLVVAQDDKQLVGFDVKMAELFALAQRWADLYPADPKGRSLLQDLNQGLDLHLKSGELLVGRHSALKEPEIRQIGKIANFATLNMSRLGRINENLSRHNLPQVSREKYNKLLADLWDRYPLRRWHGEAGHQFKKRKVQTTYGRQIYVNRPQQWTGFQFQTPTGDAFGLAILELAMAGYVPNLIIHDEAILELPPSADIEAINNIYMQGFKRLLPETEPKTKISLYDNRWGLPTRTLTV